jgi:apolipoprotein N-acyltransferase
MKEKSEASGLMFTGSPWRAEALFWRIFLIHFVLGVIAALALPPLGFWPLLLAMALGFSWSRQLPSGRSFVAGFALGLGYFVFALHWIGYAFLVDAEAYLWMMPFAVGGLAAFLSIYWGFAFVVARLFMRWRVPWFIAYPTCLFFAELLRGVLFTGFPWAEPGLVAEEMGGLLQAASLIGMQGLTFWLLLWASLVVAICNRDLRGRLVLSVASAFLILLPALWLWGNARVSGPATAIVPGVRLLLVQPNLSQNDKWQSDNAATIFGQLMQMSKVEGEQPTHVLWPESAVPFLLDESAAGKARIATQFENGQVLLTGAVRRQKNDADAEDFFTSILIFDDQGEVIDTYDKWRLVPGGEFLPMAWLLEPLGFRKVVNVPESFMPGSGAQSIPIPGAGLAGLLICYEVIFPQGLVQPGNRPSWLLNATNDGWFGLSTGPYQHLAQARMRSVEQGLPLVRVANSGISAIVDGRGRFVVRSELGRSAQLSGPLPKAEEATLFARFGLFLSVVSVLVAAFSLTYLCNKLLNTQSDSF